jgi:DNA-binding winged helix-turn-helix (wHTH) protein/tetratricopeptide (TPR) repeat protein
MVNFSLFSFDLESGELHLRGRRVRLSSQNAKVLAMLIEARGRPVDREQISKGLWPGVAFIDYEHAINKAISQLRSTLRDDPRQPRYIETLPRKGYRFIAEIRQPLEAATALPPASEIDSPAPLVELFAMPLVHRRWRRKTHLLAFGSLLALLLLLTAAFLVWRWQQQQVEAHHVTISIGILPMESNSPTSAALAERFRLDLSDALAAVPEVKVQTFHSFAASPRDSNFINALAKQQKVDVLLLGSLSEQGGCCQLTLEVVREADFSHLTSLHYAGSPQQLGSIRKRLLQDLFARLKLLPNGQAASHNATADAAYQDYFAGRHLLDERTNEAINQAIVSFKRSLEHDSNFSLGYSGLSSAYLLLADRDAFSDGYPMARNLALHALQLDENNAEAHAILGCIGMSLDWNPNVAEQELRRAVALDPDEAIYHMWLASLLNVEARFPDAFEQIALAQENDPFWPPVYQTEVMVAGNAGLYPRAISSAQTLTRLTPTWPFAQDELAWAYWYAGQPDQATSAWRRLAELKSDAAGVRLAEEGQKILRTKGTPVYALWRLQHLASLPDSGYHARSLQLAEWQAYAGNLPATLAAVKAMVYNHDPAVIQVGVDPAFKTYRSSDAFMQVYSSYGIQTPQMGPLAGNQPAQNQKASKK